MSGLTTEMTDLFESMCLGELSPDEANRLETAAFADEDLCQHYIRFMYMHALVERFENADQQQASHLSESLFSNSVVVPDDVRIIPSLQGFHAPVHSPVSYFFSDWSVAYLIATVIFGIGAIIGSVTYVTHYTQVAQDSTPVRTPDTQPLIPKSSPQSPFVGRITGMVDCKWADASKSPVSGQVAIGHKFALASGLMEITYNTGAKVILQGPVTYEVDSNGGFLSIGKLTGNLEKRGEKVASGQWSVATKSTIRHPPSEISNPFVIKTPTATVTDLGTEFGVEVNGKGETISHVFRGSVSLQVASSDGKAEGVAQTLHENESARVDNHGSDQGGSNRITVLGPSSKPAEFVRKIPRQTIKTLDLVDMVAGGNGLGKARDCGIDPTTGKTVTRQPEAPGWLLSSDGRYHTVPERPFVDGVFIPSPTKGPVQLDSAGHVFTGFSSNITGESWGYIWAGGPYVMSGGPARFLRGLDYTTPWHSLLVMHASKGMTFDLGAIRQANPGCKLMRFNAAAGRAFLENPDKSDVWVFVDGQLRFQREQITEEDGELKIAVALDDQSRFLTLVATDGSDGFSYDVVIFGDPKLVLIESLE